jgi:hypothetical protein
VSSIVLMLRSDVGEVSLGKQTNKQTLVSCRGRVQNVSSSGRALCQGIKQSLH